MFSKTLFVLAAAAVAANAQSSAPPVPSAGAIPPCVLACTQAAAPLNNCAFTDLACLCASAQFQADAGICLQATCSEADVAAGIALSTASCAAFGAPSGSVTTTRTVLPSSAAPSGASSTAISPSGSGSVVPSASGSTVPSATPSGAASSLQVGGSALFGALLAGVLAL